MQPKEFKYHLSDDQGRCYYIDNKDIVRISGMVRAIKHDPIGWDEKLINYARSPKYHGVFRSFTVPMKFVKDGAKIVRHVLYKFGPEARLWLNITKLDHDTYRHGIYYKGELDLTTCVDNDTQIECSVMEGGLSKYLKANEGTTYEIPIDVPEAIDLKMDGIRFNLKQSFTIIAGRFLPTNASDLFGGASVVVSAGARDGGQFGIIATNQTDPLATPWNPTNESPGAIEIPDPLLNGANFTGSVSVKNPSSLSALFQFVLYRRDIETGAWEGFFTLASTGAGPNIAPGETRTINFNVDIPNTFLLPKKEYYIYYFARVTASAGINLEFFETQINVSFSYIQKETIVKALPLYYLYQQLISKMSEGLYSGESQLLQFLNRSKLVALCGDALRGLSSPKLKTSFNDLWQTINSIIPASFNIEGNVGVLESREYAYNNTQIANVGEAVELSILPASELVVNKIKVGSQNQEIEDANAKYEPNTTHEYTTPSTRIVREYNAVSSYRLDCYGAEFMRINLEGKDTTDNKADNEIFLLSVKQDGSEWILNRYPNQYATGLPEIPTLFNLDITPKQMLLAHGPWLRSLSYKQDNRNIQFQTAYKTATLQINYPSGVVDEDASETILSLGNRLFLPFIFKFTTRVPDNIIPLMEANPRGYITFTYDGLTWKGFPNEVGVKPASNDAQEWTLLATADNNMENAII